MKRLLIGAALATVVACQGSVTQLGGGGGNGGTAGAATTNTGSGMGGNGPTTTSSTASSSVASGMTGDGGAGGSCVDLILDAEPTHRPSDIVVVVDNSVSMNDEIAALEQNLYAHLAQPLTVSGVDQRIIMLTQHGSGTYDVCVPLPLSGTNNCAGPPGNVPNQFYHYSVSVQSHDSFCKTLNTFNGAEPDQFNLAPGGWSQWLRPEALKTFVELSDDGSSCTWNGVSFNDGNNISMGQQTALDFDQQLLALSPTHFGSVMDRNYVFYSLIGLPFANPSLPLQPWGPYDPVTTSECQQAVDPGTAYQWLSKGTFALRHALGDPSIYDGIFGSIAADLEEKTRRSCELLIPPEVTDLDALAVRYLPGNINMFEELTQVSSAAQCGPDNIYIENNIVHICPTKCAEIESDPLGEMHIVFQCGAIAE